jgi:hypothetical protein
MKLEYIDSNVMIIVMFVFGGVYSDKKSIVDPLQIIL